jgi:hypothetical protein
MVLFGFTEFHGGFTESHGVFFVRVAHFGCTELHGVFTEFHGVFFCWRGSSVGALWNNSQDESFDSVLQAFRMKIQ